eukprot:10521571-Lingulodinium_polyedra.AAC.1
MKPTTLGWTHWPEIGLLIRRLPNQGYCRKLGPGRHGPRLCGRCHQSLAGRDEAGDFRTAIRLPPPRIGTRRCSIPPR